MAKKILLIASFLCGFILLSSFNLSSERKLYDDYEDMKCKKILAKLDMSLQTQPIDAVISEVGKVFLGTEYVAGTLDKSNKENLVVYVTGLDCVTFVENAL